MSIFEEEDKDSLAFMQAAARNSRTEIVSSLLGTTIDPNAENKVAADESASALRSATHNNHRNTMAALFRKLVM